MRVRAGAAALALLAHAAAADPARPKSVDPLTLFYQARVQGGLAVAATCVNFNDPGDGGPNGGSLDLAGMPSGAEVQAAFLYWSVLSVASPVPAGTPTLDGTPLAPVAIGEVMDTPCYDNNGERHFTGIFRADVTPLVMADGAYQLAGCVGTGTVSGDITEGATLFVAYCAAGSPETDIVLFDGIDVTRSSIAPFTQLISGFEAAPADPVAAKLAIAAGNGQARDPIEDDVDPVIFNGVDLDARDRTILSGGLCPDPVTNNSLYDLTVIDVSGLVPAGSTTATLSIVVQGDCYDIGAVALAVATLPGSVLREPSALDRQPAATPLRVAKAGAEYAVTWEDVGVATYDLYRGAIGSWYSHGETGACALTMPSVTLALPPDNWYLLAASVGCGGPSTLGRDSFGRERPSALVASGRPCP